MSAPKLESVKTRLENVIALARLLERVEHSTVAPDPDQYRALVHQLGESLESDLPEAALRAIFGAYPAAAELYENVNYQYAGLCRSPLETSLSAEQQARQVIERAMRPSNKGTPYGQS